MKLCDLIKQYRADHNISQRQFAIACDLSNGYISMLEKGINPNTGEPIKPTITLLKKLANGMNITVMELMTSIDDMEIDVSEIPSLLLQQNDPADEGKVEEEYLLAARSKDGKQAVRRLTKKQYEIATALIESLELNEDENL